MSKLLLLYLIYRVTGNPILLIVVLLFIFYVIDRRFIGLTPSFMAPMRRLSRISYLRRQLEINPHDTPAKMDLVHLLIERRKFSQALTLLTSLPASMQEDEDVLYDTGVCHLFLHRLESGVALVSRALAKNPGLRYGEPYLKLANALAESNPEQAMDHLKRYRIHNHSSCEALYRMAQLFSRMGHARDTNDALKQCLQTYRALPGFRKRTERRWALLARIRLMQRP